MKKLLKKSILTFAAVLAVSSTMALSAFAAITATPTYDKTTNILTVEIQGGSQGDQLTILLLKPGANDTNVVAESIVYIDQESADATGGHKYEIKLPAGIADGTYKLKVGGTNVNPDEIVMKDVVIGEGNVNPGKYLIGDVDTSGTVDTTDATHILQYYVTTRKKFKNDEPWQVADVNLSGVVDTTDATHVLQYYVTTRKTLKRNSVEQQPES